MLAICGHFFVANHVHIPVMGWIITNFFNLVQNTENVALAFFGLPMSVC
jgi:putative Mn2+ efflux pump MntP